MATLVVAALQPLRWDSRWLLVHVLLLGAISNAILVWSAHFASSVLRTTRKNPYHMQAGRLGVLNLGVLSVIAGVLVGAWPAVAAGAALVVGSVLWHAGLLVSQLHHAARADLAVVSWFYLAAALCLLAGVGLGTLLAGGFGGAVRPRLLVAHVLVNVLGWVGLTIIGTLTILWPSMLRTRHAARAGQLARVALAVLCVAVAAMLASVLAGRQTLAAAGVAVYLAGVCIASVPLLTTARQRLPSSYASWSVLAGCGWLAGSLVALTWLFAGGAGWSGAIAGLRRLVIPFALGFILQVLLGALTYLMPVVLGGGAGPVTRANRTLSAVGGIRILAINSGLVVMILPVSGKLAPIGLLVVLLALAVFLALLIAAVWASQRGRVAGGICRRQQSGA